MAGLAQTKCPVVVKPAGDRALTTSWLRREYRNRIGQGVVSGSPTPPDGGKRAESGAGDPAKNPQAGVEEAHIAETGLRQQS